MGQVHTLLGLIQEARQKVWTVTTNGPLQQDGQNFVIVSTLNTGIAMQYRIVGTPPAYLQAVPVEPGLEDGYVWLMHSPVRQSSLTETRF